MLSGHGHVAGTLFPAGSVEGESRNLITHVKARPPLVSNSQVPSRNLLSNGKPALLPGLPVETHPLQPTVHDPTAAVTHSSQLASSKGTQHCSKHARYSYFMHLCKVDLMAAAVLIVIAISGLHVQPCNWPSRCGRLRQSLSFPARVSNLAELAQRLIFLIIECYLLISQHLHNLGGWGSGLYQTIAP